MRSETYRRTHSYADINNNNYIYEKVGAVKVSVSGSNDKRDIYVVGLSTAGDTLPLNHI